MLGGATAEQIAEIKRRLPNVDMVPNNRGEITFSKKREGVVRETIDRMTASTVLNDSSQQSPIKNGVPEKFKSRGGGGTVTFRYHHGRLERTITYDDGSPTNRAYLSETREGILVPF